MAAAADRWVRRRFGHVNQQVNAIARVRVALWDKRLGTDARLVIVDDAARMQNAGRSSASDYPLTFHSNRGNHFSEEGKLDFQGFNQDAVRVLRKHVSRRN